MHDKNSVSCVVSRVLVPVLVNICAICGARRYIMIAAIIPSIIDIFIEYLCAIFMFSYFCAP